MIKVAVPEVSLWIFDPSEVEHLVRLMQGGEEVSLEPAFQALERLHNQLILYPCDARAMALERLLNSLRAEDVELIRLNWLAFIAAFGGAYLYRVMPNAQRVRKAGGAKGGKAPKQTQLIRRLVSALREERRSERSKKEALHNLIDGQDVRVTQDRETGRFTVECIQTGDRQEVGASVMAKYWAKAGRR
jgi:hypothetical protein